jgi:hypothetical protein
VDDAQHGADRELAADREPWVDLLPGLAVHAYFSALAALSAPDEHGTSGAVEIALMEGQGLTDAQACPPEENDERAIVARREYRRRRLASRR